MPHYGDKDHGGIHIPGDLSSEWPRQVVSRPAIGQPQSERKRQYRESNEEPIKFVAPKTEIPVSPLLKLSFLRHALGPFNGLGGQPPEAVGCTCLVDGIRLGTLDSRPYPKITTARTIAARTGWSKRRATIQRGAANNGAPVTNTVILALVTRTNRGIRRLRKWCATPARINHGPKMRRLNKGLSDEKLYGIVLPHSQPPERIWN